MLPSRTSKFLALQAHFMETTRSIKLISVELLHSSVCISSGHELMEELHAPYPSVLSIFQTALIVRAPALGSDSIIPFQPTLFHYVFSAHVIFVSSLTAWVRLIKLMIRSSSIFGRYLSFSNEF